MPHVGGGSSGGGGFHSGGSHSGGNYVPKTDIYGNNHSRYYIRPGFYINHIYVPYSRVHRRYHAIRGYLGFFILSIIFLAVAAIACFVTKTDSNLEDYSLNRYSEVYDHNESYEYNLLIEIIAYDDKKELDYMPIVGDDIAKSVDEMFGNQNTVFGGALYSLLETKEDKISDLGATLAECLNTTLGKINDKYYTNNTFNSKVINNTSFSIGESNIDTILSTFYEKTGYNLIIDISNYSAAYSPNYVLGVLLASVSFILFVIGIATVLIALGAVRKINEEDKNGNLEQYYEGEEKYEDHVKKHPIDEPYVYNKSEYEELKKEFTIDNSKFEIDENEYK